MPGYHEVNAAPNAGSWASLCWHNSGKYAWLELVGHKSSYAPGGSDGAKIALIGAVPDGAGGWATITGKQVLSLGRDASRIPFGGVADEKFYFGALTQWALFTPQEAARYAGGAVRGTRVSSLNFAIGALKSGFTHQFYPRRLPAIYTGVRHSDVTISDVRYYLTAQVNNLFSNVPSDLFSNVAQPYMMWGSGVKSPKDRQQGGGSDHLWARPPRA